MVQLLNNFNRRDVVIANGTGLQADEQTRGLLDIALKDLRKRYANFELSAWDVFPRYLPLFGKWIGL